MRSGFAAATALAAGLVLAVEAGAQDFTLRAFGGIPADGDLDINNAYGGGVYDDNYDTEGGWLVGFAAGVEIGDFTVEGELAYRDPDLGDDWFVIAPGGYSYSAATTGDANIYSFLINSWYHAPIAGKLGAYAGGGVGVARGESVEPWEGLEIDADTGFAWQVGFGLEYALTDKVSIGGGYRRFEAASIADDQAGGEFDASYTENSLIGEIGLKF